MKVGLGLLVLAVYLLHQDFWFWTDKTLVLGFIPIGLFYHAMYAVLAAVLMAILVKYAWPHELESMEEHADHDAEAAS